jgi:hypothetical protein
VYLSRFTLAAGKIFFTHLSQKGIAWAAAVIRLAVNRIKQQTGSILNDISIPFPEISLHYI